METFDDPNPEANKDDLKATEKYYIPYTTKNHMAYSLGTGTLGLNKGYRITQCTSINRNDNQAVYTFIHKILYLLYLLVHITVGILNIYCST